MHDTDSAILPDILKPGLQLVFCGTAPSRRSAADRAYYAHPGNYFWHALFEADFTPRLFAPAEFHQLSELDIGLTDLAKHDSGNDNELPGDAFDVDALVNKIEHYAPHLLAFTSKNAARAALGRKIANYGPQPERIGVTGVFVLPSPSGQARAYWDIVPWRNLASAMYASKP